MKERLISKDAHKILEDYLSRLKTKLKTLPKSDRQEILKEIQSDIFTEIEIEKRERGRSETEILFFILENLGKPEEVSAEILSKRLISFRGNFIRRYTILTIRNFYIAFIGFISSSLAFIIYFFGFLFLAMACFEPFFPKNIGLFNSEKGFGGFGIILKGTFIGIDGYNPRGEEILGFWIIPIGIFLGFMLIFLANVIQIKSKKYFNH